MTNHLFSKPSVVVGENFNVNNLILNEDGCVIKETQVHLCQRSVLITNSALRQILPLKHGLRV